MENTTKKQSFFHVLLTLCMLLGLLTAMSLTAFAETGTDCDYTMDQLYADGTTFVTELSDQNSDETIQVSVSSADDLEHLAAYVNAGNACAGVTFVQTADIIYNDATFDVDIPSGVLKVTKGDETYYLGMNMPGTKYNKNIAAAADTWYTEDILTSTSASGADYTTDAKKPALKGHLSIGTSAAPFKGNYNGANHKITGLFSSDVITGNGSGVYTGLFGYANGSTIENVVLDQGAMVKSSSYIGALAGYLNSGKISNCYSSVRVVNTNTANASLYVGGLCGSGNGTFSACEVTGYTGMTVVGTSSNRYPRLGGIAGNATSATFENCCYIGDLSYAYTKLATAIGGIAGYSQNGKFTNCYHVGNLNVLGTAKGNLGQIASQTSTWQAPGTLTNCYYDSAYDITYTGTLKISSGNGTAKEGTDITAALLNGTDGTAWAEDTTGKNFGYPVLASMTGVADGPGFCIRLGKETSSVTDRIVAGEEDSLDLTKLFAGENLTYELKVDDGEWTATEGIYKNSEAGAKTLLVKATLNGKSLTAKVNYTLVINAKPVASAKAPSGDALNISVVENHTWSVTSTVLNTYFTDTDGDTLTYYSALDDAEYANITSISYVPTAKGTYSYHLKAYDGYEYSDPITFTLNVTEDHIPALTKDAAKEIKGKVPVGKGYALDVYNSFADEDNDSLTVKVFKEPEDASADPSTMTSLGSATKTTPYNLVSYTAGIYQYRIYASEYLNGKRIYSQDYITVTLEVTEEGLDSLNWNGGVDVSWYNTEDTAFTLNTPAELAGFLKITYQGISELGIATDTFNGKTVTLGNSFDMNPGLKYEFIPDTGLFKISNGDKCFYLGTGIPGDNSGANSTFDTTASTALYYYKDDTSADKTYMPSGVTNFTVNGVEVLIPGASWKFEGTFDGNGKTISNVYNLVIRGGLFYQTSNAVIKDFTVDGLMIESSGFVGGIVTQATDTLIEHVTNKATVFASSSQYLGGICSMVSATKNDAAVISDCVNKGEIYFSGTSSRYCGGIAGYISSSGYNVTIENCVNKGNVYDTKNTSWTGGILGYYNTSYNSAVLTLRNCKNTGELKNCNYAGGIVGYLSLLSSSNTAGLPTLSDNVNEGHITNAIRGGGIAGYLRGTSAVPIIVKESYNVGSVDATSVASGLVGECGISTIKNCYNAGLVNTQKTASAVSSRLSYMGMGGTNYENPTLDNVYYVTVEDLAAGSGYDAEGSIGVTAKELRASGMGAKIGEDFLDGTKGVNDGYPVLADISSTNHQKNIIAMTMKGTEGVISDNEVTFTDVALDADETTFTLTPEALTISDGASISPAAGEEVTFTQSKEDNKLFEAVYTVTAKDTTVKKYTVKLNTTASVKTAAVSPETVSVVAGFGSAQLKPVFTPLNVTNTNVTWTSDNEEIAVVDANGIVTGKAPGEATVTMTTEDGNIEATCKVTVTEFVSVTGVTLQDIENHSTSVKKDETLQLKAVIAPANASNQKVTYASADETYLTVDENGLVKGIKETGDETVRVTVTSEDGELTDYVDITVSNVDVTGISQSFESTTMAAGAKKQFHATIAPANATNQAVKWISTDTAVATVSEDGLVTALKAGSTIIVAASDEGNFTASCKVTVTDENAAADWAGAFNAADSNNAVVDRGLPEDVNTATESWSASVGCGAVAIVGDYVYSYDATSATMTSEKDWGHLYKIDKNSGEITDTLYIGLSGSYYYGYVTYGDGTLYITTPGGTAAVDVDTFTLLWKKGSGNGMYTCGQYVNGYILCNGNVLDGATGEKVASLKGNYNYSSGAEVNGVFYIPDYNGVIYGFDTTTWEVVTSMTFKSGGSSLQPGVAYADGRLYWSDAMTAAVYSVKIKEDKTLDPDSFKTNTLSGTTVCTPVVYNNRVYVGGQNGSKGFIQVFDGTTLESIYTCYTADSMGGTVKIQSTPILDTSHFAADGKVYLFAVTYTGNVVCMEDYAGKTEGTMYELLKVKHGGYAYEQNACDADGAFYMVNDSGYLTKIVTGSLVKPEITTNLSTETVKYQQDAKAKTLKVEATLDGVGELSYQWQKTVDSELSEYEEIEGATENTFTPPTDEKGSVKYRCIVTNTYKNQSTNVISDSALIKVVTKNASGNEITVSFRLIGSTKSEEPIENLGVDKDYKGAEYVTWIGTTSVTVPAGSTVYDVFTKVLDEAGLDYVGAENNYVSKIKAPLSEGGEWLGEFDNGPNSGWMYTVNGTHPQVGLTMCDLEDEDVIIWHYIDDYTVEEGESHTGGEVGGDESLWCQWLKAEDTDASSVYKADAVASMIEALPSEEEATLDDEDAIKAARKAYDALSEEQAALIPSTEKLDMAEAKMDDLNGSVKKAEDLINAIGEVTLDSEETIQKARDAYDALTDSQKAYVSKDALNELKQAEAALKNLKLEQENKELNEKLEQESKDKQELTDKLEQESKDKQELADKLKALEDEKATAQEKAAAVKAFKATSTTAVISKYGRNYITLKWEAITGAQSYKIYRAASKTGSYKLIATVKANKLTYKNTGLDAGKAFYYKVRAIRTEEEETISTQLCKAVKGKTIALLFAKTSSKGKTVTVRWNKISQANGYMVYGSKSGSKLKLLKTIKSSTTLKATMKSLKADTYYQYTVKAYKLVNGKKVVLATSPKVYQATSVKKAGNPTALKLSSSKITLKAGAKKTIKATVSKKKLKVTKKTAAVRYASRNTAVAKVNKTGKVTAVSKGTTTIYCYTQNGIRKSITVTVK